MLQGHSITLIIPCYNEALGLPHVLQKVPSCVDEVLIVDNNSTDETAEIARSFGARVVVAPRQGYGAAYKVGFAVSILLVDELDFISACRFPLQNPENMDRVSRIGNWGLTLAAKVLFRYGLRDSQSGMWVFQRAVLQRLRIESDGMPLSEEIKIEALKKQLKFKEIHIPYYMRFGEKKIRKFRDGLHNLWFLLYLRFRK
jgi:dolichol-phosphate hexosyltransferase